MLFEEITKFRKIFGSNWNTDLKWIKPVTTSV